MDFLTKARAERQDEFAQYAPEDIVRCQREHGTDGGCFKCGGSGVIMVRHEVCGVCNVKAWMSHWAFTAYEGKHFHTIDGLEIIITSLGGKNGQSGWECVNCYEGRPPKKASKSKKASSLRP